MTCAGPISLGGAAFALATKALVFSLRPPDPPRLADPQYLELHTSFNRVGATRGVVQLRRTASRLRRTLGHRGIAIPLLSSASMARVRLPAHRRARPQHGRALTILRSRHVGHVSRFRSPPRDPTIRLRDLQLRRQYAGRRTLVIMFLASKRGEGGGEGG